MTIKTHGAYKVGRVDTGLFWNRATSTMTLRVKGATLATMTETAISFAVNPAFADDILPATDSAHDLGSTALAWRVAYADAVKAIATNHLAIDTTSDDRQVRINSRNFTQATGDSIAGQSTPNQTVTTTGEVYGWQFKPRVATGIDAGVVNGIGIDSELKGPGAGALSSDLRGINMYLGATGSGTIGGNVVGLRMRSEVNINPTGHIVPFVFAQHEGSQGWDGLLKVAEALGTHSMTTASDKSGGAKPGTIKVIANNTLYHIQLYAD